MLSFTDSDDDSNPSQLFLHGVWGEFKVHDAFHIDSGLHYWKGLNRILSASTLNFLTVDQPRPFAAWHDIGYTSQFVRHLRIYAKGEIGNFDYRLAVNKRGGPSENLPLNDDRSYDSVGPDGNVPNTNADTSTIEYRSKPDSDGNKIGIEGDNIFEGYFRYNLLDKESTKLPYNVGAYLGEKSVLAVGAGFFLQPKGAVDVDPEKLAGRPLREKNSEDCPVENSEFVDVQHFAFDVFLDHPIAGGYLTPHAAFMSFDYGENFVGKWAGTGTALYGHIDYFILGHHAKLALEHHSIDHDLNNDGDISQVRLLTHIFL